MTPPTLTLYVSNVRATFMMFSHETEDDGSGNTGYIITYAPPIGRRFIGMGLNKVLAELLFNFHSEIIIKEDDGTLD